MSYEHYKKILILHNVCTHPKISIVQELFMATGHRVYIVSLLIEKLQQKRDPSSNLVILIQLYLPTLNLSSLILIKMYGGLIFMDFMGQP